MLVRYAEAMWNGDPETGEGNLTVESGALDSQYTFFSRFEEEHPDDHPLAGTAAATLQDDQTNPEELLAAAQASCFSMVLARIIEEHGYTPETINTHADIMLETGSDPMITHIDLHTAVTAPGLDEEQFRELIEEAKDECLVSQVLGGITISVDGRVHDS